jgi:hypothetical protein
MWNNSNRIDDAEAASLYNAGTGLAFSNYALVEPVQIASFNPMTVASGGQRELYMDTFFTDYDSVAFSWSDDVGAHGLLCTIADFTPAPYCADLAGDGVDSANSANYTSSTYNVSVTSYIGNIRLRIRNANEQESFTMTVVASNAVGDTTDTFLVTLGSATGGVPTIENVAVTPIYMLANQSLTYILDNFYDGATAYYVKFRAENGTTLTQYVDATPGTNTTYTSTNFTISTAITGFGPITSIYSHDNAYDFTFNITPANTYGNGTVTSVQIVIDPSAPGRELPLQIASVAPIVLQAYESKTLRTNQYFANYTGFVVQLIDPDEFNGTVTITNGQSYDADAYTLSVTGLGFTVTATNVSGTATIRYYATNEYGPSTAATIPLTVYGVAAGPPTNVSAGGAGVVGGVISRVDGLMPDASSLTQGQRWLYVLFAMLIVSFLVYTIVGGAFDGASLAAGVLAVLANIGVFFYFVSIGYIPVIVVVVIGLLAVSVGYMIVRSGQSAGG